jgi:hypothetical protein
MLVSLPTSSSSEPGRRQREREWMHSSKRAPPARSWSSRGRGRGALRCAAASRLRPTCHASPRSAPCSASSPPSWGSSPRPARTPRRRSPLTFPTSPRSTSSLPTRACGARPGSRRSRGSTSPAPSAAGPRGRSSPRATPPGSPGRPRRAGGSAPASRRRWMPRAVLRPLRCPRSWCSSSPAASARTSRWGSPRDLGPWRPTC